MTIDNIRTDFPRTAEALEGLPDGEHWLARILELEHAVAAPSAVIPRIIHRTARLGGADAHFDLVYAGGTLGMIHAAVMAHVHGHRVLVVDRHRAAHTHRDWNISLEEARRLVAIGLLTEHELDTVIVARYRSGFIDFHGEGCTVDAAPLSFSGVLDMAVEANTLLALCREKVENMPGCAVWDHCTLERLDVARSRRGGVQGTGGALVTLRRGSDVRRVHAPLVLDFMGSASPIARQLNPGRTVTHLCPTVGTVARGFAEGTARDEVQHDIGEILVTNRHAEDGRQLIWEGFPAGHGRFTSYLFFYDRVDSTNDRRLLPLFETYFETLDGYKRRTEDFRILKPVFGYIPAIHHSSLGNSKRVAHDHVLCLGDAAALSSPLTYCGFGSFVRTLERTTRLVAAALAADLLDSRSLARINAFEPNVAVAAGFSKFLVARRDADARQVNEPLNMITDLLAEMDPVIKTELFRDELSFTSYNTLMSTVPKRYPHALGMLVRTLRLGGMASWLVAFAAFGLYEIRRRRFEQRISHHRARAAAGDARTRFRLRAASYHYRKSDL